MLASLLLAAFVAAPDWAGDWEIRYGQQLDQKPEWTAAGYTPAWPITIADAARPEITWDDHPDGRYRGWLLIARPLQLPNPLPRCLSVKLEYRTECSINTPSRQRSGQLELMVMTRAAWGQLARQPADARAWEPQDEAGVLATAVVHPNGNDATAWTPAGPLEWNRSLAEYAGQTVMCGFAWGGWHFSDREAGGVRNFELAMPTDAEREGEFWRSFDLARPGLEALGQAVERQDRAAAIKALADYYRARTSPVVANPVGPASDSVLQRADETLTHTYRLAGCPVYTYPDKIVWNADPFHYEQWAIALNRHSEWKFLAAAWLRTKDEKYAAEWAAQVDDWVAAMPVHVGRHWVQGPYNEAGKAPLSLDAGIRMGQSWFPAFETLKTAAAVRDQTIYHFVRSCYDHACYLMKPQNFKEGSNWGAMESNGLYHVGVLLPEFRDAAIWRETALARTTGELTNQVYPDGAQHELAPGYHGVSLGNFLGLLRLAAANGHPVSDEYVNRLRAMFDYYLKIAMPDLRTPALNDSGWNGIQGWFSDGLELFGEQDGYRWAQSGGRDGAPPSYGTLVMPYAGWVIMRTGWNPAQDKYLLFDAGPFGTGHQHEDKLGVILYAHGRRLVEEAGIYAYDESDWRRYALSTRAHSTLRVDDQDQACRSDRREFLATAPSTYGLVAGAQFDYARDTHAAGYGERGQEIDKTVAHRRRVLFIRPDYYVIVDDLASAGDRVHTATSQFLLNAPNAVVEANGAVVSESDAGDNSRLAIVPLCGGMATRIAQGEKEPELRGWFTLGFEDMKPEPAALFALKFQARGQMAYALVPLAGAQAVPEATVEEDHVSLRLPDGRVDRFRISATALVAEVGGERFEAREDALEAP